MSVLTAKERDALPKKDFALGNGRYPIPDENHARNALSRVAQYGTAAEKKAVRAAVHAKFPQIGEEQEAVAKGVGEKLEKGRK
jgi:hypothetical protein